MLAVERLQSYLRESARLQFPEVVAAPPFTAFFRLRDPLVRFGYAIPNEPVSGELEVTLRAVRRVFRERDCPVKVEFLEDYAPELPAALERSGLRADGGGPLMICRPGELVPPPSVPGLSVQVLGPGSPLEDIRDFRTAQHQGFEPASAREATLEDARAFLDVLRLGRAFLGRLEGRLAGAALLAPAHDGLVEIVGVATRPPYRRRGIAALLTATAARWAFDHGLEAACLNTIEESTTRLYRRLGFRPVATMVSFAG